MTHCRCVTPAPTHEVLWARPSAPEALDQYRVLRTRIGRRDARVIVVTSPGMGDGKSFTSVNLAGSMALLRDSRVLLIDGDMRRSTVHRMLGIPAAPGLSEVLAQKASLDDAIAGIDLLPNLSVLTAGDSPLNATELLDSQTWVDLAARCREEFDCIVIDAPPNIGVADYDLAEMVSDGVLLVIRPGHTDRLRAFEAAERIPVQKRLGAVLNDARDWLFWKTDNYYYGAGARSSRTAARS